MMVPCISLCLGLLAWLPQQAEAEVTVQHVRASKLLYTLRTSEGIVDAGLKLSANDLKGTIQFSGPVAAVENMKHIIRTFDVGSRKCEIKVEMLSSVDKSGFEANVKMSNNKMWKATDSESNVTVAILPRINADATVTMHIHFQGAGGSINSIVRLKPGESADFIGAAEATEQLFALPRVGYVTARKVLPGPTLKLTLGKTL